MNPLEQAIPYQAMIPIRDHEPVDLANPMFDQIFRNNRSEVSDDTKFARPTDGQSTIFAGFAGNDNSHNISKIDQGYKPLSSAVYFIALKDIDNACASIDVLAQAA